MKLKYLISVLFLNCLSSVFSAEIVSPNGNIRVNVSTDVLGSPIYSVSYKDNPVIVDAPLGLLTDFDDLSSGLKEKEVKISQDKRVYHQDKIKKSEIFVNATKAVVSYEGADKKQIEIEWHVADDGVAFRCEVPLQNGHGSMVVKEEKNSFAFPEGTTAFLTSQAEPMTGWKRTKPSYEEYYVIDAPLDNPSAFGYGYTFPSLFHTPQGIWVLLTETNVDGYYCGSHLSEYKDGRYSIAFPMKEENNGNGSSSPGVALPGKTPWRVMIIGESLAPIVETTMPWDLVEPKYEIDRAAKSAKSVWSWILWQDGSINYDDQKTFIDFAAELGYDNILIDNWWDTNIGEEKIKELISYAADKGVNVSLWFSSSGHWNDIEQGPINRMDRPIVRKKTMQWLQENGVKTIKVDFFGGDKQETIRLYEDILSDAADYGIDVIFHGCTLPRGWERMYPNFVGAEAVLASENMIFDQGYCDREALQSTLHPFIRNSVGIMEYGGTFLNKRMNRGNDGGNIRRTTDSFQLATSILFQNPVQNFALAPNNMTDAPSVAIEFMKNVPVTWDDTQFIDGYPGKYVVLARRNGNDWYVAGVSNLTESIDLILELPMFEERSHLKMINDDKVKNPVISNIKSGKDKKVKVKLNPASGFIIMN